MSGLVVSFWGKGGSGKSTVAAAAALAYAMRGLRVLAVSTDPTPALGLILCGRERAHMLHCGDVTVLEVDEEDVKRLWVERFGDEVYEVASAFLPVEKDIVNYVAGAPGITDQYMLYLVYSLHRKQDYDVIVWDTAAAGGSLRLLRVEEELYRHLGDAARLYLRIRGSLEKLRRREKAKTPLELIEEWRRLARGILDFLASPSHRLNIVSQPDRLGLHVTRSLIEEFKLHGIEPQAVIANMVLEPETCPDCRPWQEDAKAQQEALKELEGLAPRLCLLPRLEKRPTTASDLRPLTERLTECLPEPP